MIRRVGLWATVVTAGIGAMSAPALTADMPVKAPPRTAVAVVANWTGFYVGINGGYGWGDGAYKFPGEIPAGFGGFNGRFSPSPNGGSFSQRVSGGVFGGHVGYNRQLGALVVGLEAAAAWSGLKGSSANVFFPAVPAGQTYDTKLEWFATLTPRLGYASGNWLFYAKGGLAAGQVVSDLTDTIFFAPSILRFHERNGHVGWTAGAGVEHMWASNWIVGLEYNYVDLGTQHYGGLATGGGFVRGEYTVDLRYHTVLARLSYKANAPEAVAASSMPVKAPAVVVTAAGPWSGFYAGIHGGYGWGDAKYESRIETSIFSPAFFPAAGAGGGAFAQPIDGGLVGGHVGANYQFGHWVAGLEGAFTGSNIKGHSRDVFSGNVILDNNTETYDSRLKWLATVTPRFGLANGAWLAYAKGGLAVGRAHSRVATTANGGTTMEETTYHVGWTAGAGIEYAVYSNWVVGVEYNHIDLGTEKYGQHLVTGGINGGASEYFLNLKIDTVMGRLSYRFGGSPAGVAARY